ncbi:MAG: hypothetical protein GC162_14650 [Planctomycetes bacterium]|nr:hypothetical protein [Planctomycetota bacterium]
MGDGPHYTLMMRRCVVMSVVVLSVLMRTAMGGADDPDKPIDPRYAKALLTMHNRERAGHDLPPLELNDTLAGIAQKYAAVLVRTGKLEHDVEGGLGDRLKAGGYAFSKAGENLARGQRTVAEAIHSWVGSPPHHANMLGEFTQVGFGLARDKAGELTWVAVFGKPK